MRILYLAELNPEIEKGVYKKIKGQCDAWIHLGHEVTLIVMISHGQIKNISAYPSYMKFYGYGGLFYLFPKLFLFTFIRKSFNLLRFRLFTDFRKKDVIYFRQTPWYPGLGSFLSKVPSVAEINTDYNSELKHALSIKRRFYLFTKNLVMSSLNGVIAVTDELNELYSSYNIPSKTVSNGYDYEGLEISETVESGTPNLIFVSSELPWHGSNKVFELASVLTKYQFHVVGPTPKGVDDKYLNMENLTFHGILDFQNLSELYKKMHIGIGSLSLYLYNLTEACPLKTREYLAHGLPVIIGYKDTDFSQKDDFVLHIGSYENNVSDHIDEIEHFVEKWKTKRPDANTIRSVIDYKKKENERLEFLEQIANDSR